LEEVIDCLKDADVYDDIEICYDCDEDEYK